MTLYPTPLGYTSRRPAVAMPAIDRRALMRNAHALARKFRAQFATYRLALAYGLWAAWGRIKVARSIMMLNAQVTPRIFTVQIEASRRATGRCGSSMIGM